MHFGLPPLWVLVSIPLFAVALAQNAEARPCTTACDCPKGFACTSADGGGSCTWSSCESNSDCGQGFSCYQGLYCGVGKVPGNACVPQWETECTVDSDCGSGFKCVSMGSQCQCGGDAGVPEAGVVGVPVSVPCTDVGDVLPGGASPSMIAQLCDAGPTCECWGAGACQPTQMGACSQSTDCPIGWTCAMMACQPPNWDLMWTGPLYGPGIACVGPTQGQPPGLGGSTGSGPTGSGSTGAVPVAPNGAASTGGCSGTGSNAGSGPTGAGRPPTSGSTASTERPTTTSGGCEIAMTADGTSSCVLLMFLASAAGGLRRKVKSESRLESSTR
jgi:hypothetical protein